MSDYIRSHLIYQTR